MTPTKKPKLGKNRPKKPRDARSHLGQSIGRTPSSSLIVGIGASAGGLDAFKTFFANMPPDSGMAFVLVQHLSPDHKSVLADLIGRMTTMPVVEAENNMPIASNTVYVIPPDATLTLKQRSLHVSRPAPPRDRRRPIDTLFSSLAEEHGENAICIVLSGTGSDGTLGLKTIKEHGGLTFAQAEIDHTAKSGMPQSAAATGLVDEIMPVEEMPAKLLDYQNHLRTVAGRKDGDGTRLDATDHLAKISALLRARVGHDFSKYKEKTLIRRIQRRMQVLQIDTVQAYIARLREDPHQVELLFRELLIGVTQFFRDPDAFAALATAAIPKILDNVEAEDQIRLWVPGCATGEEVYSVAILLKEALNDREAVPSVQIFGTDIDNNAIAIARAGRYRTTTGLSSQRLARWFVEEGEEYCPIKPIREMCVFSTHSVVKDPPFSKLDLISCRNLLIYLDTDLQDRILKVFHYALKPDGILFLGPAEGVTRHSKLFGTLDKKHRIFRRLSAEITLPDA
ncbi:MAG: chemotaxis protein CheB, partial [Xanthobacteraceae bacterium]